MALTKEQEYMCALRLKEHQHEDYTTDINLGCLFLKGYFVRKSVFRPETTSGIYLARYLANNAQYFKGKSVLDLCCGSGIQGIVMGKFGAKKVHLSDISPEAVLNTQENISRFGLKATVSCGDLFENIGEKFDLIVCNHPFFDNDPDPNNPITKAWFNRGELLQRLLSQAPTYLNSGGKILMPYFPFAGKINDPSLQAAQHGYVALKVHEETIDDANIQKGVFNVYLLEKTTQ